MIQTNCELPNCLLSQNNKLNDYDFVLYHLYLTNKTYRDYYRRQHPNRFVILDNSQYEFFVRGEEFNEADYVKVINEIRPNIYLLPDKLMDYEKTMGGVESFLEKYSHVLPDDVRPMGVLQGNSAEELLMSLDKYVLEFGLQNIAVPFHNSFFKTYVNNHTTHKIVNDTFIRYFNTSSTTTDMDYAIGRVHFYRYLLNKVYKNLDVVGIYNEKLSNQIKRIHMLGSHCPYELKWFNSYVDFFNLSGIEVSMDTGFPVKSGICGKTLKESSSKSDIIIDEFIDKKLDVKTQELIINNIKEFKKLCKRK